MKKNFWIILFAIVFLTDLVAVSSNNEMLRYMTKPLLMPLLIGYFISSTQNIFLRFKKWMILALTFSWLGDVLLMFENSDSNFFIFGLIAFLLAHIFYIILFDQIRVKENFKQSLLPLIPIAVYYFVLISVLQPKLGAMQKPVRIYGLVISIMLSFAIDLWRLKDKAIAGLIILGALFFISSDSILAINKFYKQFDYAGIAVMSTYGIAQLLIALGVVKYIRSVSKE